MAKAKNKRNSGLADKVRNNRRADMNKKKLNPFEVHINKEKIKVLGKKSKHDRGLPGVARAKAMQKRKETLGTEMKLMNKTNAFIDRRIGEKNNSLSAEDKMVARFATERARQHSRKNIYNLADDEILTHRGQTLEQIEKFDDPRSSDEEDEGERRFGGLDDEFVSEGHFGGGVLSKTDSRDGAKSHKDLIEQLIAESKKRKAEKQKEKEQTLDLTEKLDTEWKDLQPVVFKRARTEEKKEESIIDKLLSQADKKSEDYDKTMRELKFDKRGTPSDALKNEQKIAKEEKEKLEQLEKERQQRMLGEHEQSAPRGQRPVAKHRSADDLDDNFELEDEKEFMLAYDKDGKPLVPEHIFKANYVPNSEPKFDDGISDTSDEDDTDAKEESNESGEDEEQDDAENETSNEEDSDDEQSEDDATPKDKVPLCNGGGQKDDQSEEINNIVGKKNNVEDKSDSGLFQTSENENLSHDEDSDDDDDKDSYEELDKENIMDDFKDVMESEDSGDEGEEVKEKIQSFFDLKSIEGDNLKELLSGKTPTQQSVAIQKLIKTYDPGLAENNKEFLSRLFAHMLQYVNDIFTNLTIEGDVIKAFLTFDKLAPHFYDLAKTNKVSTKKFIVELLKEKRDIYKKHPKRIPDLDTLIFFKLVSLLYPTSDFRHPVATPSLIFMSEILTHSRFSDAYSISRGLFVVSLILEYTALSKRYLPAGINFIRGILYLSANTSVLNPIEVVPPFKLHRNAKILNLEDDCSHVEVGLKMTARDLVLKTIDNDFKIRCLLSCVLMLKEFFSNCDEMDAQECIFQPHLQLLKRIDLELYPKKIFSMVSEVVRHMKESLEVKTYTPLSAEKKKPKALRLYEPDVEEVFTGSKSAKLSREKAERDRLKHKYKKEMKGALREIRRDKAYIASVKIRQKIQSDNMRKEKVKQIYKDAALQQGELNKLKRMK